MGKYLDTTSELYSGKKIQADLFLKFINGYAKLKFELIYQNTRVSHAREGINLI